MRGRLAVLVGATALLVLAAFVVPLAVLVRTVAADRAVNAATREAESVAPLVGTLDRQTLRVTLAQVAGDDSTDYPLTVFLPDGTRLGAPAAESTAVELARAGRSVTAELDGGREILVATQGGAGGTIVIRAFVAPEQLHRGVAQAWLILGLLGISLLALSLFVADRLARSLVGPMGDLAGVAHRLARGELGARAVPAGPPELREIATGLNLLAGRISELLTIEREQVADLSHRLRTPLTALRLNVEAITAGGTDAGGDAGARARLTEAVDGIERTVDRVIREASRPVREGVAARCDATTVVRARLDFWSVLAEEERRPVESELPDRPAFVRVAAEDLAGALDAVLGNVFAHTPPGTAFAVHLEPRGAGGAVLTVSDHGPGLPDDRVLDRGASREGSTGLGLDIVRRTAAASGGAFHVGATPSGGARIVVELGPPAAGR